MSLAWSAQMPTTPGVYWYITSRTKRMRIVEILETGMMTVALNLRSFPGKRYLPDAWGEGAWFYGPIRPPELAGQRGEGKGRS